MGRICSTLTIDRKYCIQIGNLSGICRTWQRAQDHGFRSGYRQGCSWPCNVHATALLLRVQASRLPTPRPCLPTVGQTAARQQQERHKSLEQQTGFHGGVGCCGASCSLVLCVAGRNSSPCRHTAVQSYERAAAPFAMASWAGMVCVNDEDTLHCWKLQPLAQFHQGKKGLYATTG